MFKWMKQIALSLALVVGLGQAALAAPQDDMIFDLTNKIQRDIKNNGSLRGGNKAAVSQYVDGNVMPHVNFPRWVATMVGPTWNNASSAEQNELVGAMKKYFVNTFSPKLVKYNLKGVDVYGANGNDVKTVFNYNSGKSDTIIFHLENSGGWKVYDMTYNGVRVSNTYRGQFKQAALKGGVPGVTAEVKKRTK